MTFMGMERYVANEAYKCCFFQTVFTYRQKVNENAFEYCFRDDALSGSWNPLLKNLVSGQSMNDLQ